MISVRENVFESNSSSCHSITFSKKSSAAQVHMNLELKGGSYQWQRKFYDEPQDKLSYWLNAFAASIQKELCTRMTKFKKTESYLITRYLPFDEKRGPCDLEVYKKALEDTAEKLRSVLKKLEEFGVIFTIESREGVYPDSYDDVDDYIEHFKEKNEPDTIDKLCKGVFDFLIDLNDGIDHQSAPNEDQDCNKLAHLNADGVADWVLGNGHFETGNDNEY